MPQGTDFQLTSDGVVLRGTMEGNGRSVVLLHAGRERRSVWRSVAAPLVEAGLRCVSIDQRGHGDSTGEANDLDELGRDVRALVRSLDEPVALVGCSLGGLAALASLGDDSTRAAVVGLVLIDVVPAAEAQPAREFLRRWGLLPAAAVLFEQMLDRGDEFTENLLDLDRPALLVRAERSAVTDTDAEGFATTHRAEVVDMPGTGHLVARDDPTGLARVLTSRLPPWFAAAMSEPTH